MDSSHSSENEWDIIATSECGGNLEDYEDSPTETTSIKNVTELAGSSYFERNADKPQPSPPVTELLLGSQDVESPLASLGAESLVASMVAESLVAEPLVTESPVLESLQEPPITESPQVSPVLECVQEPPIVIDSVPEPPKTEIYVEEVNPHDSSSDVDIIEEGEAEEPDPEPSETNQPREAPPANNDPNEIHGLPRWLRFWESQAFMAMAEQLGRYVFGNTPAEERRTTILVIILSVSMTLVFMVNDDKQQKLRKEVREYEDIVKKLSFLETENKYLKNEVLSKLGNDKLFSLLHEQIGHLKSENSRISHSMEELIEEMEKQTKIFLRENHIREKEAQDPFKQQIDKLKEQVNILRIDNDELQKQLVRMRYGSYPSQDFHMEGAEEKDNDDDNESDDEDHDRQEHGTEVKSPQAGSDRNSSEALTEEITELRKKVFSELEKLKNWKGAVHHLLHELGKMQESSDHQADHKKKAKKHGGGGKEKSNSNNNNWSWKELKKSLKVTFDKLHKINVSDMFSRYVAVDMKKVDGVFDSINHYFRKAQEKTKKMFQESKNYGEDGEETEKDSFWQGQEMLKSKWKEIKSSIFNRLHQGVAIVGADKEEDPENEFSGGQADHAKFKKHKAHHHKDKKHQKSSGHDTEEKYYGEEEKYEFTSEEQVKFPKGEEESEEAITSFEHPVFQDHLQNGHDDMYETDQNLKSDGDLEEKEHSKAASFIPEDDSWLFQRAALRSEMREEETKGDDKLINWYLRRKKELEDSFGWDENTSNEEKRKVLETLNQQ